MSPRPLLRIERGAPTDAEIAAVLAVCHLMSPRFDRTTPGERCADPPGWAVSPLAGPDSWCANADGPWAGVDW